MLRLGVDCKQAEAGPLSGDMVQIAGSMFWMGPDHHHPGETPSHRVSVDSFWIDRTPVRNRQFKAFEDGYERT